MNHAKALTYTCYQMYARMETGIAAEFVQFRDGEDFRIGSGAPHYLLRPETVESFFILNQLTGDPIFREWGWEVFQSIEKYCRTKYGYGTLSTVQNKDQKPRDKEETFFMAETVKVRFAILNNSDLVVLVCFLLLVVVTIVSQAHLYTKNPSVMEVYVPSTRS